MEFTFGKDEALKRMPKPSDLANLGIFSKDINARQYNNEESPHNMSYTFGQKSVEIPTDQTTFPLQQQYTGFNQDQSINSNAANTYYPIEQAGSPNGFPLQTVMPPSQMTLSPISLYTNPINSTMIYQPNQQHLAMMLPGGVIYETISPQALTQPPVRVLRDTEFMKETNNERGPVCQTSQRSSLFFTIVLLLIIGIATVLLVKSQQQ